VARGRREPPEQHGIETGDILTLLRESVDAYGQTTLMVTHDPGAAATELAERTDPRND